MIAHATVCAAALKPNAPTGLKIAAGDSESRTYAWELPDSYTDGTPFPEGVEVSQVKIFRNLKEICLLDGPATEFTDFRTPDYPGGYDNGLLIYEVSVKVGEEWSEPCMPLQYYYGTIPEHLPIPWEPLCKGLTDRGVWENWKCDSRIWKSVDEGMICTADESVENRNLESIYPLFLVHRHDYVLEYQISSSDNTEYEIVMFDKSANLITKELVIDAIATDDNSVKKVEFTFLIDDVYGGLTINEDPTIVLRPRHGKNLLLSSMRIYESETTTAPDVFNDADIRDVRFYNMQGRSVGVDPGCFTPGIYIRRQTDSHGNVRCDKLLVR